MSGQRITEAVVAVVAGMLGGAAIGAVVLFGWHPASTYRLHGDSSSAWRLNTITGEVVRCDFYADNCARFPIVGPQGPAPKLKH